MIKTALFVTYQKLVYLSASKVMSMKHVRFPRAVAVMVTTKQNKTPFALLEVFPTVNVNFPLSNYCKKIVRKFYYKKVPKILRKSATRGRH